MGAPLTCVEGQEVERVDPGQVVARVHVDGLEQPNRDPRPQEEHVVGAQRQSDEEPGSKDCRT